MTERFQRIRLKSSELGRMAQLVGHTDQIGQIKLNTVPHGLLAQLVEHIVHIDGVTGSSPVQTTKSP